MIYFIFVISLFAFVGCSKPDAMSKGYEEIGVFSKEMHKKHHWAVSGIGGLFDDTIEKFNLDYHVHKEADIAKARRNLVFGVEKFLYQVNNHEKTKPFLLNGCLEPQQLKFGVGFDSDKVTFPLEQRIVYALMLQGKISYSIKKPEKFCYITVHDETYEEARQIVMNENPELLQAH